MEVKSIGKPSEPVFQSWKAENPKADKIANERMSSKSAKKTGEVVASAIQDQAEKNTKRDSLLLNNIDRLSKASDTAGMAVGGPVFQAMKEGAEMLKADKDSMAGRLMGKLNEKTGLGDAAKNAFGKVEEKTGIKKAHNWLYGDEKERAQKIRNDGAQENLESFSKSKDGRYKDDRGRFLSRDKAVALQKEKESEARGKYSQYHTEESISRIKKIVRIEQRERAKLSKQKPILQKVKQEKPKLVSNEQDKHKITGPLFRNREEQKSNRLLSEINETLVDNDKNQWKRDKDRDKTIKKSRSSGFSIFDLLGRKGKKGGFLGKLLGKSKIGRFAGKAGGLLGLGGLTFGLISTKTIFKGLETATAKFSSGFDTVKEKVGLKFDEISASLGERFSQIGLKYDEITASLGVKFDKITTSLGEKIGVVGTALENFGNSINERLAKIAGKDIEDMTFMDKVKAWASQVASTLTLGNYEARDLYKLLPGEGDQNEKQLNKPTSLRRLKTKDAVAKSLTLAQAPSVLKGPTLIKKPSRHQPTTVDKIDKAAKMIKETTKSSEKIIERNNNTVQEKLKPVYTDADRIPVPLHQRAGIQALWLQGK